MQNEILLTNTLEFSCTKCNRQLQDVRQVKEHVDSPEHASRMMYTTCPLVHDPLAAIPFPHRQLVLLDRAGEPSWGCS